MRTRIADLSEEELIRLGFLGEGVAPGIQDLVKKAKANPKYLGSVTCFMADCLTRVYQAEPTAQGGTKLPASPTSPTFSPLSDTETLWSKLSSNSDALTVVAPDMVSKYEIHFYYHGIGNLQLMWRSDLETNPFPIPAPGTRFFKIPTKTVPWRLRHEAQRAPSSYGSLFVPNTAKPRDVCDATPDILQILAKFNITDVVVQWYEGSVVRLDGPPLMSVVKNSNAKFGLNTPFNTGQGIPIARQSDDAQGTLTLLFKELDEADPQHILVCGERRLDLAITEIEKAVAKGFRDAVRLFEEVEELEKALALDRKRNALKEKNEDHAGLKELFDEVKGEWKDSNGRRFGIVDWAPKIAVRVDEREYTRDIATFAVDDEKLKNFVRNSVDLGNQYTAERFPASLQLPICSILPRLRVLNPDTMDKNGNPLYIVGKAGYTCTEFGLESREVVVYNHSKTSGDFSDHGDSGSLIFTGDGDALAMLHSGMPRGMYNHVTYGTPMWWVIKQVRLKYPSAEFYGITYTLED
ncbi:hypothetical protein F5887DRAFT_1209562 [Amanita rubescens]|nr:hypothetical protein F5887DRAFT_1209562 [Amanita rubescens]